MLHGLGWVLVPGAASTGGRYANKFLNAACWRIWYRSSKRASSRASSNASSPRGARKNGTNDPIGPLHQQLPEWKV
jgi:hypothetical protein